MKSKNRKQKKEEYDNKYGHIPVNYYERLSYMVDLYNLSDSKMQEILDKRDMMMTNMQYYDYKLVVLYEDPEGAKRPRFRLINKKNFHIEAINNSQFVHVYSPNAQGDYMYMKQLSEQELLTLNGLINTPCIIEYDAYFKTPSYFNVVDTFIAELGLNRQILKPDWDNIGKKYSDMYNHNIWLDDNLVISGTVNKYYSILPRIEIKLRYLNCLYNKKIYDMITSRKEYDGTPVKYLDKGGNLV